LPDHVNGVHCPRRVRNRFRSRGPILIPGLACRR
jgi:hypothetical protein